MHDGVVYQHISIRILTKSWIQRSLPFFIFWGCRNRGNSPGHLSDRISSSFPSQAGQEAAAAAATSAAAAAAAKAAAAAEASALLFLWQTDVDTSTSTQIQYMRLQKLSVFLHHLIYTHIFCLGERWEKTLFYCHREGEDDESWNKEVRVSWIRRPQSTLKANQAQEVQRMRNESKIDH